MAGTWHLDPRYDAGLEHLAVLQARESALFAERARTLAHLAARTSREGWQGEAPFDSLLLDVAGTCVLGQVAAGSRLLDAEHLVVRLPLTLERLEQGELAVHQAQVVVGETRELTPEVCAEVERRVLLRAPELCPADLRRLVRRTVLEVDADEQARRAAEAVQRRRVWVKPVEDGMALLCALLPAEQAQRAYAGLTEQAREAGRAASDGRCADELRADVLVDLLAGGASPGSGRPLQVVVHVPLAVAVGLSDAPGELEGYGPLSASHARRLLDGAVLRRACVDPETGEVWAVDEPRPQRAAGSATGDPAATAAAQLRTTLAALAKTAPPAPLPAEAQHDPSRPLARLVRARDGRCDGIGCSVPSSRCELDHLVPWPEGLTGPDNLRPRSQRCHHAKHTGWSVAEDAGGSWWTSPAGRRYRVPRRGVHPPPRVVAAGGAVGADDDQGADHDREG
ncbi:MAG: endonuclease [Frankiales bacterium]|nr:endonuclease [Frankiales bacterium]